MTAVVIILLVAYAIFASFYGQSMAMEKHTIGLWMDSLRNFHPRAWKLMNKQKPFVVIADDEPYFPQVFAKIREHEIHMHSWSMEDERKFLYAINKWNDEHGDTYGRWGQGDL